MIERPASNAIKGSRLAVFGQSPETNAGQHREVSLVFPKSGRFPSDVKYLAQEEDILQKDRPPQIR